LCVYFEVFKFENIESVFYTTRPLTTRPYIYYFLSCVRVFSFAAYEEFINRRKKDKEEHGEPVEEADEGGKSGGTRPSTEAEDPDSLRPGLA